MWCPGRFPVTWAPERPVTGGGRWFGRRQLLGYNPDSGGGDPGHFPICAVPRQLTVGGGHLRDGMPAVGFISDWEEETTGGPGQFSRSVRFPGDSRLVAVSAGRDIRCWLRHRGWTSFSALWSDIIIQILKFLFQKCLYQKLQSIDYC